MAQRRMFSPEIVCSDDFLEMPPSSRDLYYQLAIRADDDGFIQPKSVMKLIGSGGDDLKILLAKRFLLPFETGVVVIKHWLIHNMIRADRYKPTRFQEEKNTLYLKDNKSYTDNPENGTPLMATKWQPNGNLPAPQVRLGKDSKTSVATLRVVEDSKEVRTTTKGKSKHPHSKEVYTLLGKYGITIDPSWKIHTTQLKHAEQLWERGIGKVEVMLKFVQEHKNDDLFPQVLSPYDLNTKWQNIKAWNRRNS